MVEPEDAKPESRPCPNCGRFDRVANVAAVREHEAEPGGSKRAIPAFGEPGRALLPALPPRYRPGTRPTRLGRRLSPMPLSSAAPLVVTGLFASVLAAGGYELHKGSVQYGSSFPFGLVPAFVGAAAVSILLAGRGAAAPEAGAPGLGGGGAGLAARLVLQPLRHRLLPAPPGARGRRGFEVVLARGVPPPRLPGRRIRAPRECPLGALGAPLSAPRAPATRRPSPSPPARRARRR